MKDKLNEVELELTKLKVQGTGVTNLTAAPMSSVLHDSLKLKKGHEDFLRRTSFVSNVPFLQSSVHLQQGVSNIQAAIYTTSPFFTYNQHHGNHKSHLGLWTLPRMDVVTIPYVSMTNIPFYRRPISSVRTASRRFPATTSNWQVQQHCWKAPSIDEFTAEDSRIIIDDWI